MKQKDIYTPNELKQELKKKNKYNNRVVILEDGTKVQSVLENKHKTNFELLKAAGKLKDYKWQLPITLLETFTHKGETVKGIKYIADHYVVDLNGVITIYDSKGMLTEGAKLKIKMLKYRYPFIHFKLLRDPKAVAYEERKKQKKKLERELIKKGRAAKPNLFSTNP